MKYLWLFIFAVATLDVIQFWNFSNLIDTIELNLLALWIFHKWGVLGAALFRAFDLTFIFIYVEYFVKTYVPRAYKPCMIAITIVHFLLLIWVLIAFRVWGWQQ